MKTQYFHGFYFKRHLAIEDSVLYAGISFLPIVWILFLLRMLTLLAHEPRSG